jgi:hypothetical protein
MNAPLSHALRSGLLSQSINAYTESAAVFKKMFHKDAKHFLKQLASALALTPGSYEIRVNAAGVAVSGEVTLHHDRLYVQLSESCTSPGVSILYRSCKGREDYCGGANQFVSIRELLDADRQERFLAQCRRLLAPVSAAA